MNKSQLARSVHYRVRLRPVVRRFMGSRELKSIDDDWLVADVPKGARGVEIHNIRTGHVVRLAPDQIHHFSEDIARDTAVRLKVEQIQLVGCVEHLDL